jgi:hypothetical protein
MITLFGGSVVRIGNKTKKIIKRVVKTERKWPLRSNNRCANMIEMNIWVGQSSREIFM